MAKVRLSFASSRHDGIMPLMDGAVEPEGVELVPIASHPGETFWRQLRFGEFEISEMSVSSYLIARSQGVELMAIPTFPSRSFFQTILYYNADSGIQQPSDVTGKRWGIPSINRRRPCGRGGFWSMTSACRSSASTGLWSAARP